MSNLKGPFGESIKITQKTPKSLLSVKNATYCVDSYFKNKINFPKETKVIYLKAGESLKTIAKIESLIDQLIKLKHKKNDPIVCIGGGSLGDTVGFLASIYLRGVPLYQVPTTWLSVIDSSIGGKTALNFKKVKNQIGSFYPPVEIVIIKDLLKTSSLLNASGEILKTLALNVNKKWAREQLKDMSDLNLERFLKYKINIVKKDLYDTKNVRAVLNLGHTLAHAFELEFMMTHSEAVEQGLGFALNWSKSLKILSSKKHNTLYHNISKSTSRFKSASKLKTYLEADKKSKRGGLNFIFLSDKGPVVKSVKIQSVVDEYFRQVRIDEV